MTSARLIIFDLNGTLIRENTWQILNRSMGVTAAEDAMLVEWGNQGIISDQQGQEILASIYKKRGTPTKEIITQIVCDYHYFPGARETIQTLQQQGYIVAIISGAMDLVVASVAKDLALQHWYANNVFIFDKNDNLERIKTAANESIFKQESLEKLCEKLGIRAEDCVTIGDGTSDIRLFERTGHSIAVEGTNAAEHATYIVQDLGEIPQLLQNEH